MKLITGLKKGTQKGVPYSTAQREWGSLCLFRAPPHPFKEGPAQPHPFEEGHAQPHAGPKQVRAADPKRMDLNRVDAPLTTHMHEVGRLICLFAHLLICLCAQDIRCRRTAAS